MAECQQSAFANPESQHHFGHQARRILEDAREGIGRLLGAMTDGPRPDRLIFTSGGTEANNLALFGLAGAATGTVVISAIEHPSVARPAEALARRGWRIERVGASAEGVIELDQFADAVAAGHSTSPRPKFASVMLANNETGVIQPIAQFAALARDAGILLHTDAAQAVGKVPVDFCQLGVAALALRRAQVSRPSRDRRIALARRGAAGTAPLGRISSTRSAPRHRMCRARRRHACGIGQFSAGKRGSLQADRRLARPFRGGHSRRLAEHRRSWSEPSRK